MELRVGDAMFDGHDRCGPHRPKGVNHAWCETCTEDCTRSVPCVGCAGLVLDDIKAAIAEARQSWGDQLAFPPAAWLAILVEEVGEVARIVCDHLSAETGRSEYPPAIFALRRELYQVVSTCLRWDDAMLRGG